MDQRTIELTVIPLAALFTAILLWVAWTSKPAEEDLRPDFGAIKEVKVKKETFFQYMLPKVQRANDNVLAQREKMLPLLAKLDQGQHIASADHDWLQQLADRYRVKEDPIQSERARELLEIRVDTIPASLALAQAANESAWGTARFAREGNNFFGLWCFTADCGIVPSRREASKTHEVASFETVTDGVNYYFLQLNSHPAYKDLRDLRYRAQVNQQPVSGIDLAGGLTRYSERGQDYIDELRSMIRHNELQRFNEHNLADASSP